MILLPMLLLLLSATVYGQTIGSPIPTSASFQFFTNDGATVPCVGCKLCTYAAGTNTPLAAYTDYSLGTPQTNPIILDSAGRPTGGGFFIGKSQYKIVARQGGDGTCSTGSTLWSQDHIADNGALIAASLAATGGASLVGYKSSLASAVATTLGARATEEIYVKEDFGAACDGSTNDTAAFQAALDAGNGKKLNFCAGTLLFSSVTINKGQLGMRLQGVSRYGTILKTTAATGNVIAVSANSRLLTISDFEFQSSVQRTGGAWIDATGMNQSIIQNLRIQSPFIGMRIYGNSDNLWISNVSMIDANSAYSWEAGIEIDTCTDVFLDHVTVNFGGATVSEAALDIRSGIDTMVISDSGFGQTGGGSGIGVRLRHTLSPSSFAPRWIRFSQINVEGGSAQAGIQIEQGRDVELQNVYSVSSLNSLRVTGGTGIKVMGGIFGGSQQHNVFVSSVTGFDMQGSTVSGGSVSSTGTYDGIYVDSNADHVLLADNTITNDVFSGAQHRYGINFVSGAANVFYAHGNVIRDTATAPIFYLGQPQTGVSDFVSSSARQWVANSSSMAFDVMAYQAAGGTAFRFLDGGASPTKYNWLIGSQVSKNNCFEITPSTAIGGTTFTTPIMVACAPTASPASTLATPNFAIGMTGTTVNGTTITAHYQYTANLNAAAPGSVPGCSAEIVIPATNLAIGDTFAFGNPITIANNFSVSYYIPTGGGQLNIRYCQFSGGAADPDGGGGVYKVDVWKH